MSPKCNFWFPCRIFSPEHNNHLTVSQSFSTSFVYVKFHCQLTVITGRSISVYVLIPFPFITVLVSPMFYCSSGVNICRVVSKRCPSIFRIIKTRFSSVKFHRLKMSCRIFERSCSGLPNLFFLLRFHPKHSDRRQTKARGYSGRKEFKQQFVIYESEYKAKKN